MGIVALPTQVARIVSSEIDTRYLARAFGILGVTATTEAPLRRFAGSNGTGIGSVLFGGIVTRGALEPRVMRNRFLAGDLSVTGVAGIRHHRWNGSVRVVTVGARDARVVHHGVYLRETGRPTGIVGVTARTKITRERNRRFDLHRVRHVWRGRFVEIGNVPHEPEMDDEAPVQ